MGLFLSGFLMPKSLSIAHPHSILHPEQIVGNPEVDPEGRTVAATDRDA